MKILIVGSGAREQAIAEKLRKSPHAPEIAVFGSTRHPVLAQLATDYAVGSMTDMSALRAFAEAAKPDAGIVGPEAPLAAGAVDTLASLGIPAFGPTQAQARIESSKGFARTLMTQYSIAGSPACIVLPQSDTALSTAEQFMRDCGGEFVVKADGLKSGKGVMVTGDHLAGIEDGLHYTRACLEEDGTVVLEEKLIGEEFSLMFFVAGDSIVPMPTIQDHKRALPGDKGMNTGGMGTYSTVGGVLPFLTEDDIQQATDMTNQVVRALAQETGTPYRGILYGGFMATKRGVQLIEYNARFGDPEAMNALSLLETDLLDIMQGAFDGTLPPIHFSKDATVVKYAVPEGYPEQGVVDSPLIVGDLPVGAELYYASVTQSDTGVILTTGGRAAAVLGRAPTLAEAEQLAEAGVQAIKGQVYHRPDIGTAALVQQRVDHMKALRG